MEIMMMMKVIVSMLMTKMMMIKMLTAAFDGDAEDSDE